MRVFSWYFFLIFKLLIESCVMMTVCLVYLTIRPKKVYCWRNCASKLEGSIFLFVSTCAFCSTPATHLLLRKSLQNLLHTPQKCGWIKCQIVFASVKLSPVPTEMRVNLKITIPFKNRSNSFVNSTQKTVFRELNGILERIWTQVCMKKKHVKHPGRGLFEAKLDVIASFWHVPLW